MRATDGGRARVALLLVVTVGCLTACGGDRPAETRGPEPPPSASASAASPPPTAAPDQRLPCVPGVGPFGGPAAEEFGAETVMTAYCRLVRFSLDTGFTSLMVPDRRRTAAAYRFVRPHLTPRARARWDDLVRRHLDDGDPRATRRIAELTLHDVTVPHGYRVDPDGPYAFGTEAGPGTASVTGPRRRPRLRLTFPVRSGVVLERLGDTSGRHSLLPVTRRVTFTVRPPSGAAPRWLVDEWRATLRTAPVRLATGG